MAAPEPASPARPFVWVRPFALAAAVALALAGAVLGVRHVQRTGMERRMLAALPDRLPAQPELLRFAADEGRPLFAKTCAVCHRANMKGQPAIGSPNLTDGTWLYGEGDLMSIERTILYGIRTGAAKSHDITEMPAFGLRGQLNAADIGNVVQYTLALSHLPHDVQAAELGRAVYNGGAACFDCHGPDGSGNSDYGAPDLTANIWLYGGDPRSLYNSVYYGRHGVMPGWYGKLTLQQIRALAAYVYVASHH